MHVSFTGVYTATEACNAEMLEAKSTKIKNYLLSLAEEHSEVLESFVYLRASDRLIEVDLEVEAESIEEAASRADTLIKHAVTNAIGKAPDGQMYLTRKSSECEIMSK